MADSKQDNKVKGGTVVYTDGRRIGVNTSGEKVGGTGPDKDRLKDDVVLDARSAQINIKKADGSAARGHLSDIRPGDKISAGWVPTDQGNFPTSMTVTRTGDEPASGPVLKLGAPYGSEHGPQAIQTGVSHPELNYPNTHQEVGAGGTDRLDPTSEEGTPDAAEKLAREDARLAGKGTKGRAAAAAGDEDAAPDEDDAGTDHANLNDMTKAELTDVAQQEGVDVPSHATKDEIVKAIKKGRRAK